MEQFLEKAKKSVVIVFYLILTLAFFNTCNSCNRNRQTKVLVSTIDSLIVEQNKMRCDIDTLQINSLNSVDLQIEGLKNEKRMIQSCDRKVWDLNRQTAIDNAIDSLTKIKYSK